MMTNELQKFWFAMTVEDLKSDLHDHEYTNSYSEHIAEAVLKDAMQARRQARTLDPSIPAFNNRIWRRALEQALKTLGTAEEHYAQLDAETWPPGRVAP
jgi:hypothetical protein